MCLFFSCNKTKDLPIMMGDPPMSKYKASCLPIPPISEPRLTNNILALIPVYSVKILPISTAPSHSFEPTNELCRSPVSTAN